MDAKQAQVFQTETARTVNLITAALRDCFNWHVENMGEPGIVTPEQVLHSKLDFAALADFGAKLVMQHTGKRIVFVKATNPLLGWLPETLMFMVPPDKVNEWKTAITQGLAATAADLMDEWAEIQAEMAEDGEDGEDDTEEGTEAPTVSESASDAGGDNA